MKNKHGIDHFETQHSHSHTPTPWTVWPKDGVTILREGSITHSIARCMETKDAAFIACAVNAHEAFITQIKCAVNELTKYWERCDKETGQECKGKDCFHVEHRVVCHLEEALALAKGGE
jgi:hypothetical protein